MSSPGLTVREQPCPSCPYRRDAPSGLWDRQEYERLPDYDGDIGDQAQVGALAGFQCHLQTGQLCAGWVGCHGPQNLLALRLKADRLDPSVWDYQTSMALHPSGQAAHDHGVRDLDEPDERTRLKARALERLHVRRNANRRN